MTAASLSDDERALLAREVAADKAYPFTLYGQDHASRLKFIAGWDAAMEWVRQQLPQSVTGAYVSCWICRKEHEMGVKFCSVLSRL